MTRLERKVRIRGRSRGGSGRGVGGLDGTSSYEGGRSPGGGWSCFSDIVDTQLLSLRGSPGGSSGFVLSSLDL